MQSLIDTNPRVQMFMKMNRLLSGQRNDLDQKKVLIDHFGSEVGLSMELYNKVVNGRATEEESIEYKAKSDALAELAKNFNALAQSDIQIAFLNDRSGGREVATRSPNQFGE